MLEGEERSEGLDGSEIDCFSMVSALLGRLPSCLAVNVQSKPPRQKLQSQRTHERKISISSIK